VYAIKPDSTYAAPAPLNFPDALFGTRRISALPRKRKVNYENRALPGSFTLRANRSPVQLNEVSRHRKSQPETALLSRY
jgi:hypothetical protein